MALPNLWHRFNLRESPFFQETLKAVEYARYPIDLFVGRQREVKQLLQGIGSGASSRQLVEGAPGVGKTTLVQYVKAQAAAEGYLSLADPVSLASTDSSDRLLEKILSYVYEALLTSDPTGAFGKHDLMQTARQIVRAFQVKDVNAQLSLFSVGVGGGRTKQFVQAQ